MVTKMVGELQARYAEAVMECQEGQPRRFIETYLKINPAAGMDGAGPVVPFRFMPTQAYMYGRTFGARVNGEGFRAVIAKSRDVYATALFAAAAPFALAYNVPGIRCMVMIDNEDKFKTVIIPMMKGFYANLDEGEMGVRRLAHAHWDTEVIEFEHLGGGRQANSFIKFVSSKSVDAPRSYKPNYYCYSEAGFGDRTNEPLLYEAVDNSIGVSGRAVFESTANGSSGNFYDRYGAYKAGRLLGEAIFVPFFADPLKRLRAGSAEYLLHMKAGGGRLSAYEQQMATRFPGTVPVDEVIAWWRMKHAEAMVRLGGDQNAALASMNREYPVDDVSMWTAPGNPRFDQKALTAVGGQAREPLETRPMPGGWTLKVWEAPMAGRHYAIGMDFAVGKNQDGKGDETTLQVFDATTMTFVAELNSTTVGVFAALDDAVAVCRMYGNALFVPENDTVGTTAVEHFQVRHGYDNIYHGQVSGRPLKLSDYGWDARGHVLDLWALFQGYFNQGSLKMPNGALSADCARYDPNRNAHWPDRMRAAALALHGAKEHGLLGKDGAWNTEGGPRRHVPVFIPGPRGVYFGGRR